MKEKNKKDYTGIYLDTPENLVLDDLISPLSIWSIPIIQYNGSFINECTTGNQMRILMDAMSLFIHELLERLHTDNDTLRYMYDKEYVAMFSRDIEPLQSKNNFKLIWSFLKYLDVIEYKSLIKPTKYRKAAKAYFFKLGKAYADSKIIEHQIWVRNAIVGKLNRKLGYNDRSDVDNNSEKNDISTIAGNKMESHQYWSLQRIHFDSDAATKHVDGLLNNKEININQYNTSMVSINSMVNRRIRIYKSPVCERFFTNISWMPKILRSFIKDSEGKGLVELDFGSFNAFVVYKILNGTSPKYESNADKIAFENELDLYRRILNGGDFYKDFKSIFFPDEDLTRDQVKKIVLWRWFNGKINSRDKYRDQMMKRLPRITSVIDSLKVEKYENFSNTAMKMESELVNGIIYTKFIDLHPDVIMYTIFDSFLIEQKYATQLQSMMLDEGKKYFNINCIVRAK